MAATQADRFNLLSHLAEGCWQAFADASAGHSYDGGSDEALPSDSKAAAGDGTGALSGLAVDLAWEVAGYGFGKLVQTTNRAVFATGMKISRNTVKRAGNAAARGARSRRYARELDERTTNAMLAYWSQKGFATADALHSYQAYEDRRG